jgi:3-isopropylmalate/(R)-2-methylmalate dehydratase large subunit
MCYPDESAFAWLRARTAGKLEGLLPDVDAVYEENSNISVDGLEPMVAPAGSPAGARRLGDLPEVPLDQVVIGSESGGRIEDLRLAARLLKEHNVHPDVRLVIIPGNQRAKLHAVEEGLVTTFLRSGAVVAAPSCGLWADDSSGTVGAGETCLSTCLAGGAGRQGPVGADAYLASPAVAAASAVMGRIAHPDEVLRSRREAV